MKKSLWLSLMIGAVMLMAAKCGTGAAVGVQPDKATPARGGNLPTQSTTGNTSTTAPTGTTGSIKTSTGVVAPAALDNPTMPKDAQTGKATGY